MMVQVVHDWLSGVGLAEYADAFEAAQIDVEVLADGMDAEFAALDVPLGPRKRLPKAIAALDAYPGWTACLTPKAR